MKTDKQISFTRECLVTTLGILLQEKDFKKITVNDICTKAGVSRSAFYSHYQDKYDLFRDFLNNITDGVYETIRDYDFNEIIDYLISQLSNTGTFIYHIFVTQLDYEVLRIAGTAVNQFTERMIINRQKQGFFLNDDPHYLASFYSGGVTSILLDWANGGFKESKEEIKAIIEGFTIKKQ